MEFVPICIECDHFRKSDYCPFYQPIPHEIKNRETKCPHFSGGEYDLFTADAHPKEDHK